MLNLKIYNFDGKKNICGIDVKIEELVSNDKGSVKPTFFDI